MAASPEDFVFLGRQGPIRYIYIVMLIVGAISNYLVMHSIIQSKQMLRTPKYWLVLGISVALFFQAVLANFQVILKLFESLDDNNSCSLWQMAVIYNTYVCVGMVCWSGFLIYLDYFICSLAPLRMRLARHKVMGALFLCCLFSTFVFAVSVTANVAVKFEYEQSASDIPEEIRCRVYVKSFYWKLALLWITFIIPMTCSLIVCLLTVLCKRFNCQGCFEKRDTSNLSTNLSFSDSMSTYSNASPPVDLLIFLILAVLLFVPSVIFEYMNAYRDFSIEESSSMWIKLVATCVVFRDNAGCFLSLAWFFFTDMRNSFKRLPFIPHVKKPSDSAFQESSEFRLYDSYPYCASVQL